MNNFTAPTDIFNKTGTGTCGGGGGGVCEHHKCITQNEVNGNKSVL